MHIMQGITHGIRVGLDCRCKLKATQEHALSSTKRSLAIDQYLHNECEVGQSSGHIPGTGYKLLSTYQPFCGTEKFAKANYKSLGTRLTMRS